MVMANYRFRKHDSEHSNAQFFAKFSPCLITPKGVFAILFDYPWRIHGAGIYANIDWGYIDGI